MFKDGGNYEPDVEVDARDDGEDDEDDDVDEAKFKSGL